MKKILALLLVCSSLMMQAAVVSRYKGSRIFWDTKSTTAILSGGYARLIQLYDGRLMACSESGGIKIVFSNTLGKTWGTPRTIAPNPSLWPNCVPDLIQLQDSTIIVAYNPRAQEPYTDARPYSIRLRRSTDLGKTWSDEITVYDAGKNPTEGCWEPSMLQLPDGELQLYFADESPYDGDNTDQQISLCRSFDGGLTWSAPQCVSYRSGHRDGMPVPILLRDQSAIVVAIEDNGYGVGDFLPATVRCTLQKNWPQGSYVPGTSSMRDRSINTTYCPLATGGAPYLRQLPSGETVLSHQSRYGTTDNQKMYVYVGNNKAKDFKSMSCPFLTTADKDALWNSLAVIDTGVVVAVGGISGQVTMIKGYVHAQFEAALATPTIDGKVTSADHYYTTSATQVLMGNQTGAYTTADFAWDADSLYFVARVDDKASISTGDHPDLLSFSIEGHGLSTDVPMNSTYRWDITPEGDIRCYKGNGKTWVTTDSQAHIERSRAYAYYRVEMAIPWTALGLSSYPTSPSVNLRITNSDGTTEAYEVIPDAHPDQPATWMPLHLQDTEQATSLPSVTASRTTPDTLYNLSGQRTTTPRGVAVRRGKRFFSSTN